VGLAGVSDLVAEVQQMITNRDPVLDHATDIVVGRRGMSSAKRLLVGSTSEAVANLATVPVIVVPDGWKPADHAGPVVVGLDDSGESEAAIEFAATAAAERHTTLRLLNVWDLPSIYSWDAMKLAGVSGEWSRTAEQHFDAIAQQWRHKYPELIIEVEVRRGHAVDGVIATAEAADAQLVVVGGRHHHKVAAILLGSVARGVLRHATCPVAVVHLGKDDV
jgi:nucleotide-binding universal stress UspA family protein